MIKALALFVSIIAVLLFLAPVQTFAYDAIKDGCTGEAANSEICKAKTTDPVTGREGIIYKVAILISYFAGVVGIIMLIYSGFMFVTSNGDSAKITKARQTILYVVVGLFVIVIAAQLVAFVISKVA